MVMMFSGVLTSSRSGMEKMKNNADIIIPTTIEATMLMA